MTAEELEEAVNKLIAAANADSETAKKEYEEDVLRAKYSALENRIVRKIQSELDESLEALYAENEEGGGGTPPSGSEDAPYEVDYSLSMRDRYVIVKNYYLVLPDKA